MNKSSVAYLFRRIALIEKFGTEEAADFFLAEEAKQRAIEALRLIKAAHKVEQRADPPPRPLQRQQAQEAAILAKLAEMGIDAQAVPLTVQARRTVTSKAARA